MSGAPQAGPGTMRACVLHDVGRVEVRDVPMPRTGPRDVLLRVSAVGLCGTDLHIFGGEANYNYDERGLPVPLASHPQILGHEIAGVVAEVGAEVRDLREGDAVALDQGLNCVSQRREALCEYCATGDSHQCEFYREHGITGLQGGLAEYIAVPAVNTVRIESGLEPARAALTEPLACIVHSSELVGRVASARYAIGAKEPERRVRAALIFGAGPAGLLFVQHLRRVLGFDGLLLVCEPNAAKRELARAFGAETIDPTAVDVAEAVLEKTGGRRVEYLIEASGAGQVFPVIPGVIRKQATVVIYGHGHSGVELGVLNRVQFREPTIVTPIGASGGFDEDGRPSVYRQALRLIERGEVEVAPFITHRYKSLEDVQGAFVNDFRAPGYTKGVVELS